MKLVSDIITHVTVFLQIEPGTTISSPNSAAYSAIGGLDKEITQIRDLIEIPLTRPDLFRHFGGSSGLQVLLHLIYTITQVSSPPVESYCTVLRGLVKHTWRAPSHHPPNHPLSLLMDPSYLLLITEKRNRRSGMFFRMPAQRVPAL